MNREKFIQAALVRTMATINVMKETSYEGDVKKFVKITNDLSLEINAIVNDFDDAESDYGKPLYFEVYAIKKGITVDCMTIDTYRNFEADITYLLNCYV